MKRITLTCTILILLGALIYPTVGQTAEAAHYRYDLNQSKTLDYYFSSQGVKMDVNQGEGKNVSILYRVKDDTLITLDHNNKAATKISRSFLKETLGQVQKIMEKVEAQLDRMPAEQRKKMKRMMKSKMPDYEKPEPVDEPEFVDKESIEWNGMPAQKGSYQLDGESKGEMVMLTEVPIDVSDGARKSLTKYQSFLKEFVSMVRAANQNSEFNKSLTNVENLFGTQQLKLAEIRSDSHRMKLTNWESTELAKDAFSVPKDYEINEPELPNQRQ